MSDIKIDGFEFNDDIPIIPINNITPISEIKKQSKEEFGKSVEESYKPTITQVRSDFGKSEYDEGLLLSQIDELDWVRADRQPGTQQAFRAVSGGLYKGVLTAVEDAGYLLDLENNINRLSGLEEIDSNWLSDLAKGAKKSYDENHPIYRYNPEKIIDWSDPGFYWTTMQGIVDSAVGFGMVGVGAGATVGKGLKYITSLGKFGIPVQNLVATAGTALTTNYAEGKMMALEMFTGSVDKRMKEFDKAQFQQAFDRINNLNPNLDPNLVSEEAKKLIQSDEYVQQRKQAEKDVRSIAGNEADTFQKRNMIFMASDALAINGMFRGAGYSRNLLKDKSLRNTASMIAKQAPTEYLEEVGQGVLQKEGEYQILKQSGMDIPNISSDPIERALEFTTDPQTQLEGLMGLFGGPVQHMLVQAPMNIANRDSDKSYRKKQAEQVKQNEQLINGLVAQRAKYEQAKQDAVTKGDIEAFNLLQDDEFSEVAYRNFNNGTVEDLENHLNEVINMSPEEASEKGYSGTYSDDAKSRLDQLNNLENTYLKIIRNNSGKKDYLVHKRLFDIENKRSSITNILSNLKQQKETLLNDVKKEVNVLEDKDVSDNQLKVKKFDLQIQSLIKQKSKLTAIKNEALIRPNKRFDNAKQELNAAKFTLNNAKRFPRYFDQAQIQKRVDELYQLQNKVNRLSQFANEKTKNKKFIQKINDQYEKQLSNVNTELNNLKKESTITKEILKSNKEKINAFNNEDYSIWEDLSETQSKIDNFTIGKKLYDDEYSDIKNNKDRYISDIEDEIKNAEINAKQVDIDNEPTVDGKTQIILEEQDDLVKEELNKRNKKNIQDIERFNREDNNKNKIVGITTSQREELNTTEEIDNVTKQFIIDDDTIEDVKIEVDNVQDNIILENSTPVSNDGSTINYEYSRVENGYDLLAHLSRNYNQIIDGDKVTREDVDNELNEESFVKLLNPNKYNTDTKITLEVSTDDSIIIDAINNTTWRDFIEVNKISDVNSDIYINSVPIVVLDQDKNVIGYLHQDSWINEENIYGDVKAAKDNLYKIRKKIIQDGKFDTIIKSKSIGYFFRDVEGLKKVKDTIVDPDVKFAIGGRDELFSNVDLSNLNLTNKQIISAYTYMVVNVGKNNNGSLHTAIPLINTKVSESTNNDQISNTISNAIRIYYKLSNKLELSDDENKVYNILGSSGFDLGTSIGLTKYVNQFVKVFFNSGGNINQEVKKFKTPSTKTLLSVDNQQIQFYYRSGRSGFINPSNTTIEQLEKSLTTIREQVVPFMYTNIDKDSIMNPNNPLKVIIENSDGLLVTENIFDNYIDYLMENTTTDVLSKKVDTIDNKDIYTYTIQPKVEIDFSNIIVEDTPIFINNKQKNQLYNLGYDKVDVDKMTIEGAQNVILFGLNKVEKVDKPVESDDYEKLDDSDTFGNPDIDMFRLSDDSFLPEVEESLIEDFKKISGNIINGLNVENQEAVIDILFKEALIEITDSKGGQINVNNIFNTVFSEIQSNLNIRLKNVDILNKNLNAATKKNDTVSITKFTKLLNHNKHLVQLYEAYILNKDNLTELAKNRLSAEDIIRRIDLDEDGNLSDSDHEENSKTFDKSSYEVDKSAKLSKTVKRFLAGVRSYTNDGFIQKNKLGREKLMNYEDVYNQLQVITKNLSPDYDIILNKIKEFTSTFPFLNDVINKLENKSNDNIESIRNQITILLSNHYNNSKFIIWRKNKDKSKTFTIVNSNSNSIEAAIKDGWNSLFNKSNLVKVLNSGDMILDVGVSNSLIDKYNDWKQNIPDNATDEVKEWLSSFGIILDDKTWGELESGNFKRYGKTFTWKSQFKSGIFNILATQYLNKYKGKSANDFLPTNEGIVNDLAKLDGKFTLNFHSNSHREGLKTVYSYNTNKFITDNVRDFKLLNESVDANGNKVFTNTLITDKMSVIFNKTSSLLNDMLILDENDKPIKAKNGEYIVDNNSTTYQNLDFFTVSLESLKQQGQISRNNRELNKLSSGEIELVKLSLLTAPITDISGNKDRVINLLYPTTSDKTTVIGLTTKAADVEYNFENGNITNNTLDVLYDQLVLPEINRILHVERLLSNGTDINLESNYINGSKKFLFLSELNDPKYGLFNEDGSLNSNIQVEYKPVIYDVIKNYIDQLVDEKLDVWKNNNIINDDGSNNYIDSNFYNKFSKVNNNDKVKGIATDMVIQYLIGNANTFQSFIGDPALFYKKNDIDTYINIGKRLSADIAPGEQGDDTMNNSYKQVFVKDRIIQSKIYENLTKLIGSQAEPYKNINSTDAQEYTTLLEKLYVMNMHGKIDIDGLYTKVHDIIINELNNNNYNYINELKSNLNKVEYDYLKNIILQPDKPVYVKNITDRSLGLERRLYIKSSSFALSPFLTEGNDLDNIRIAMEKNGISRLAYDSAVKVGNVNESATLWNEDGNIVEDIKFNEVNTLIIPRSGFKIQQEVPYNPLKNSINKVTQASKNLFVNLLEVDGFKVGWFNDGKEVKGAVLNDEYIKLYDEMFNIQQKSLFDDLEYNINTGDLNINKLKDILKEESIKRNYPISDLQALDLDNELKFISFSPSSTKFESLLNSIVTNRIIKMKFPGKSYVLGSDAGFTLKSQDDYDYSKMDIVWTSAYNGKELLPSDGSGRPDQAIMPWDFKESIDNYIDDTGLLDLNKIPKELLNRFGMRIPNQGLNLQSKIEVVGFFKKQVGDLLIAPKEFVVRMGSDFDVDKLYIYKYSYLEENGKLYKTTDNDLKDIESNINITKENLTSLLSSKKEINNIIKYKQDWVNNVYDTLGKKEWGDIYEINSLSDDLKDTKEDIMYYINRLDTLKKLKDGIYSQFNKILDIHFAIHENPNPQVQRQIHQPLDFWKLDFIANNISNSALKQTDKLFTGLSDEYQKQKFINAAAGKSLVGSFSNDSMFNALVQGKNIRIKGTPFNPFIVEFGNIKSTGDMSNPFTLKTQNKLNKVVKNEDILTVNPYNYLDDNDIEYKSEVISGFQSAAVDNEKEQILDKINANTETSPTIKVLSMLGFGEEIPYFLSQDIIKDYVLELKKLRGVGDFVDDVEGTAMRNIISKDKYIVDYDENLHKKYANKELTISKMKDMISGKSVDNYRLTQRAILDKYVDLKIKGRVITKLEGVLNLDSQGLGKSFFETLIQSEELEELNVNIDNFEDLVYNNTIPSMAINYGLMANNKLWKKFLPYDNFGFRSVFQQLENLYNKSISGREARSTFRSKMWNEIKKYRFSDPNLFTKNKINNPNFVDSERKRLFIDSSDNKSIASIISDIKPIFLNNRFLQSLNVNVKKDGLPSIIKFRASTKQFANENRIYESIVDLLINEQNLGKNNTAYKVYNKDNYTSRDLFQDLILSAYLNGGVQEVWQYVKYIPPGYLHLIPFFNELSNWVDNISSNDKFIINENQGEIIFPDVIKQIIQNNPEQLPKVVDDDFIKYNNKLLYNGPMIGEQNDSPKYFTLYDKNIPIGYKKFKLYERIGVNTDNRGDYYPEYIEIPVVGTSGKDKVSEYNYLRSGYNTTVYGNKTNLDNEPSLTIVKSGKEKLNNKELALKPPLSEINNIFRDIGIIDTYKSNISAKEVIKQFLNTTSNNSLDSFNKTISNVLLKSFDKLNLNNFDIQIVNNLKIPGGSNAKGLVTLMPNGKLVMKINSSLPIHENKENLESTILHEIIHVVTKRTLNYPNKSQLTIMNRLNELRDQTQTYFKTNDLYKDDYAKYISGDKSIKNDTDLLFYATSNVDEFISMMFTNQQLQTITNDIQVNNKSILERFIDDIVNILRSIGLQIKEHSILAVSLDSIMKIIESQNETKDIKLDNNKLFSVDKNDISIGNKPLFDDSGNINDDSFLPDFIPSPKDILSRFNELNRDGTVKKLRVTDDNAKIMLSRVQSINKGQPYYKATYDKSMGEEAVVNSGREYYRVYLQLRKEAQQPYYLVDLVPDQLLKEIMKQCK